MRKHTGTLNILQLLKKDCCITSCLNSFSFKEVREIRIKYWSKTPKARKQWIFDKFLEQEKVNKDSRFLVERGKYACPAAFIALHDINKSVYYRYRTLFYTGVTSATDSFRQRTTKYLEAMNWLERYVSFHGDRMPDCNVVFLPYKTRKYIIYTQYRHETQPTDVLKRSTFYKMWTSSFPNVKIKEVSTCI